MATVYLADVGFRNAGVRLAGPVRAKDGAHTLTLDELIATPDGTDLTYYLTGLTGEEGYTPRQDVITIAKADEERVLTRGAFSFGSDRAVLRRRISSTSVIPQWTGQIAVAIAIEGVGEFRLAADLRPFGPDSEAPRRDVNTSVTHDGITVTIRGVGAAREETAIEVEVGVGKTECCVGIGAMGGHRLGATALSLRDEDGRVYTERTQDPGSFDHTTLALFQPLHPGARELELIVPYVFVEESTTTKAIPLPVTSPVETLLGRYPVRVLGTERVVANPRTRAVADRQPALGVQLDLGGWHGDRRVLMPGRPLLDGEQCNSSYRFPGIFDMRRPEPVDGIEVTGERALVATTLTFTRPSVQVRGPWRIRFGFM